MADYGITLGYEKEMCSVCKEQKEVRYIYHKPDRKIVAICDACALSLGTLTTEEMISRFGKKTTQKHIEILSKEQLEKRGYELTGKKEKVPGKK